MIYWKMQIQHYQLKTVGSSHFSDDADAGVFKIMATNQNRQSSIGKWLGESMRVLGQVSMEAKKCQVLDLCSAKHLYKEQLNKSWTWRCMYIQRAKGTSNPSPSGYDPAKHKPFIISSAHHNQANLFQTRVLQWAQLVC